MKKNKLIIVLLLFTIISNNYCQEDSSKNNQKNQYVQIEIPKAYSLPEVAIELYLEDTNYYMEKEIGTSFFEQDKKIGYFRYFTSTSVFEFMLKDSLPDGHYCLYNLTKKQAKKTKNKEDYIIASGKFKNGMKQGTFMFRKISENPCRTCEIKYIDFTNDTVDGIVKELENWIPIYLAEYKMGVKNGFCFYANSGVPVILLYKDGVIVKETTFLNK